MADQFALPIDEVRPTQLSLDGAKLAGVLTWFDVDEPAYDPLPVFELDNEYYLADGHTRAFVASMAGATELGVEHDPSIREDEDMDVYRACIEWCVDDGVETIDDLWGRVVGSDTFEDRWIERCRGVRDG